MLGDTKAVTTYSDYRDFGGVKFPMRVRQTMGGYPVLDLAVTAVEVNPAASFDVPEAARNQAERVVVERLGAGVWFLAGGSHNSVAIEMADHLVLVEAPLNDARTLAVIEQVKTLAPGKPIRYVVNSHGHFDHSGGVRAAVAEGATVVTGAANVPYFERAFATPNALRPDRMAQAGKAAKFVAVADKLAMADADARDRAPRHRRLAARRELPDGLPAAGEDPDRGRRVHAGRAECAAAGDAEPEPSRA